jgi:hypothetical protein
MTKTSKRMHSFLMSVCFSILVWLIISKFLFTIELWQFIIIEIAIAIGQLFSTFVKEKVGIKEPEKDLLKSKEVDGL